MQILILLLRILALILVGLGLLRLAAQGSFVAVLLAQARYASTQPECWLGLGGFVVFTALARRFDRRVPNLPPNAPSLVVDASVRPVPPIAPDLAAAAPLLRARDVAVQRLRLEAFARGQADIVGLVDEMIAAGWREGASDIHLTPGEHVVKVAFRVRGAMLPMAELPANVQGDLVRRIKVLSGLKTHVDKKPQDGRLHVELRDGARDLRVSILPTQYGENVVLRFGGEANLRPLEQIGLAQSELRALEKLLAEPQGLLVLCGPTGSGKTTTLYSALELIHRQRGGLTIATIEDPIELELPFAAQSQVDRDRGLDFAQALRAVLRQDPNILLIGEVRDAESAGIAVQAGLSGHLILTSLHADGVWGVPPRLIDLGVEPFLVASALVGVVAQRQINRLCPECRHAVPLDLETLDHLRALKLPPPANVYRAMGCASCQQSGRAGRRVLAEVLPVTSELRRGLASQKAPMALFPQARANGWRPLVEIGLELAAAGEVSLDEVLAVAR